MDSICENIVIVGAGNPDGILFNFVKVMQQSGVKVNKPYDIFHYYTVLQGFY